MKRQTKMNYESPIVSEIDLRFADFIADIVNTTRVLFDASVNDYYIDGDDAPAAGEVDSF